MRETVNLILMTVVISLLQYGQTDSQYWGRGYSRSYSNPWGGVQRYGSYRVAQPEPQPEPSSVSDSRSRRLVSSSQQLNPRLQNLIKTTTKPFTFITTQTTTPVTTTTATTTIRTTTITSEPDDVVLPLFDLRDDSDSLFDDVFDTLEDENDSKAALWRISPGQFDVVAAVPGEPVKSTISRLPKSVPKTIKIQPQFSPIPAVPFQSTEHSPTQISEQFERLVDLSDGLPDGNSVEQDISTDDDDEKETEQDLAPKETITSNNDKKSARKKFKKCQGQCVQQFCLPVGNLDVYAKCVEKCKNICT